MKSAIVKIGEPAPPFDLPGVDGGLHSLETYAGRLLLLVFFRGHW